MKRKCFSYFFSLSIWAIMGGCVFAGADAGTQKLQRFEYSQPHMATLFRIVLYAADKQSAEAAATAAFKKIEDINQMMSDYLDDSELMQLCKKSGGPPVKISAELFDLIAFSRDLSVRSNGAFDITVGPVVRLWRKARKSGTLPDKEELAKATELVGYQKMLLDEKQSTVQLLKEGMRLDLGGIAKGDVANKAIQVLKEHGIESALVVGGGDICVSHSPPGTDGWTIGIGALENPGGTPGEFLLLHDAGISTAGDFEQNLQVGGKRYSHIIDPKTGMPLNGRTSVTVVSPTGRQSDGLDTTVDVLGIEKGLELIESVEGAAALIVRATDKGQERIESKRWKDLLKKKP